LYAITPIKAINNIRYKTVSGMLMSPSQTIVMIITTVTTLPIPTVFLVQIAAKMSGINARRLNPSIDRFWFANACIDWR